jgi:hypothetical protein
MAKRSCFNEGQIAFCDSQWNREVQEVVAKLRDASSSRH